MAAPQTYADLQAQVARWNGGSSDSVYDEAVRDAIALAENDLDRALWVPERIKRTFADFQNEYESIPPDLAKLVMIKRVTSDGFEIRLREEAIEGLPGVRARYRDQPPIAYALAGSQIQFAPPPTAQNKMRGRWIYYEFLPRLSDATSCTAILLTYGDVYLWTSLKHIATYTEDQGGIAKWQDLSERAILAANRLAVMREATVG
jgi:hypothetical protein